MKLNDLKSRADIGLVLREMGLNGIGAEIGVAFGGNAEFILQHSHLSRLLLVDPWAYVNGQNPVGYRDEIKNWNECFQYCTSRLKRFGDRAEFMRMSSADACNTIADESLDFVYIDANHMSPYINDDIARWYPKVRVGGIIGGHDYYALDTPEYQCDVKTAVNNFFTTDQIHLLPEVDSSWYVIKRD